jgi:AbrB family looped-hinge helix DNA binding protein
MRIIKILAKGQIVIPANMRQRFGIKPGTLVEIREAGDHLEIYPLPEDPIAAFRGTLKTGGSLADALIREHKQEIEREADG